MKPKSSRSRYVPGIPFAPWRRPAVGLFFEADWISCCLARLIRTRSSRGSVPSSNGALSAGPFARRGAPPFLLRPICFALSPRVEKGTREDVGGSGRRRGRRKWLWDDGSATGSRWWPRRRYPGGRAPVSSQRCHREWFAFGFPARLCLNVFKLQCAVCEKEGPRVRNYKFIIDNLMFSYVSLTARVNYRAMIFYTSLIFPAPVKMELFEIMAPLIRNWHLFQKYWRSFN